MWSGLPSWSGIIGELAAFLDEEGQSSELVRREVRTGDLLQAASFGVSKLTPTSFGTFIRRVMQVGVASPQAIHKAIVELGPNGFITTNYDTLMDQALSRWRTDAFFPAPVTNKHLVELADIVSARSSHFMFKPHGDIGDVSSIILTREQYRTLMPGGERQSALEALKTLLVTRPILYIGFGLRDPDFIYLRDLLLNIYQGAVRDHWAIMSDVGGEEVDYWRSQYGIKLLGYETHENSDGSRDHRDLLPLIESLSAPAAVALTSPGSTNESIGGTSDAERVLTLTRYTSGLVRRLTPANPPVEVRISRTQVKRGIYNDFEAYENWTTTQYLTKVPGTTYLIGLPGSGKSFAIRLAVLQLSAELQQACLDDTLATTQLVLPILLDLKLYRGDLGAQIDAELPAGFTIGHLRGDLRLKLFLDAFNEMPSEFLEHGMLFKSLDALEAEIGEFDYAITSRTADGLPERSGENTFYEIDRFESCHVDSVLAAHQITLSGRFADDVRYLLSRPFFLQLVVKGLVEVPDNASPRDLLTSFVGRLQAAFSERFATDLQLLPIFSKVAYRAIESESEAFPLHWLSDLLAMHLTQEPTYNAGDVVNWLIAREVLTPYTGRRASFIHQSITEYCAATELARRSRVDMLSLRDTISSKKWDQCLYLALALMEPDTAEAALKTAIEADFNLAINAVRYAEEGQSAAVTRLLVTLIDRARDVDPYRFLGISLNHLPVGPEHIALLKQLLTVGNSLAGEAVGLITQTLGAKFKPELLDLLEEHADDFNFAVNGIAPALSSLIEETDLTRLMAIANIWLEKKDDDNCSSISAVLSQFTPEALLRAAKDGDCIISSRMVSMLGRSLSERTDDASFELLAELLLTHPDSITSSLCLALGWGNSSQNPVSYRCLDYRHAEAIWSARSSEVLWDGALSGICRGRPDLTAHVEKMAEAHNGIEAIALRYCAGAENESIFTDLENLLEEDDAALRDQDFSFFRIAKLEWQGREPLLVKSIARDVPLLRQSLLSDWISCKKLERASIGLAIMLPVIALAEIKPDDSNKWWLEHRLGAIVAHLGDTEVQSYLLRQLVTGSGAIRHWIKANYLGETEGINIETLDDDMVATLLADLNVPNRISEHWYNPLGHLATDRFVRERLIPLAAAASTPFNENLTLVLKAAGDRHGKRYLLPT